MRTTCAVQVFSNAQQMQRAGSPHILSDVKVNEADPCQVSGLIWSINSQLALNLAYSTQRYFPRLQYMCLGLVVLLWCHRVLHCQDKVGSSLGRVFSMAVCIADSTMLTPGSTWIGKVVGVPMTQAKYRSTWLLKVAGNGLPLGNSRVRCSYLVVSLPLRSDGGEMAGAIAFRHGGRDWRGLSMEMKIHGDKMYAPTTYRV